ncbi:MAG: hypothetical protein JSU96_20020 [Acidobacteriota bacterium]|nr:MAG: hypothetical protein JSU96_20020 [Acidobacteriota bacterium]
MLRTLLFSTIALVTPGCPPLEVQEIKVTLEVPDTAWSVTIQEVRVVGEELWVISKLERPSDLMGAQVISQVTDSVTIKAPRLPVKHLILGKTWNWENDPSLEFITNPTMLEERMSGGKVLFQRKADPEKAN